MFGLHNRSRFLRCFLAKLGLTFSNFYRMQLPGRAHSYGLGVGERFMPADFVRRRALLVARSGAEENVRQLFSQPPLESWDLVRAESFAQARCLLQHSPCDVVVVLEELFHREGDQALAWLARSREAPVVMLTDDRPWTLVRAYSHGAALCLPRETTLTQPALLAAALDRAAQFGECFRSQRRVWDKLDQCRRHLDRVVNLMWKSAPIVPNTRWFTERYTLDRLHEELTRAERHGFPLTVAVAEISHETASQAAEPAVLDEWTSNLVARSKRRCDLAGQYGMRGFLLLMTHTKEKGGAACCRRLKNLLESAAPSQPRGAKGPVRAYFGLAVADGEKTTSQMLLRRAEENLESAKKGNNDGIVAC
jgi:diguanylate cyclase (GGDEF)-like protein